MKGFSLAIWPAAAWLVLVVIAHSAAGADKEDLQGVWVATSGEINGQPASAEDLKRTRFTFKGDKLLVRLHKEDKQDSECSYKIRADKMPKQIDIGAGKKTLAGIYQVKGDELKLCFENGGKAENRPKKVATNGEEADVLRVLKRQKP